jgi:signal transduction histidine kinase
LTILTQDPVIDTLSCPVFITGLTIMDDKRSFDRMSDLEPYFETSDTLWSSDGNQLNTKNTLPQDSGYVFDHDIQWDSLSSPYKLPIGLQLPYDQNYLQFSFANLCVLNRDKISFRYMLEGADDTWIYAGQEPQSKNYFNLPPGAYTFRVATRGIKGQWGDPAEFSFRIFPPWWQTWWAYLAYAILAFGGIWAIVQYRSRQLKEENRLLEEKVTQRTDELRENISNLKSTQEQLIQQEKLASLGQLTAGIAHEIKNPLNFVNNFSNVSLEMIDEALEELGKTSQDDHTAETAAILADIKTNLTKIHEHGSRADGIVKSMLQHSRGGSGKMEPADLNQVVKEFVNLSYHGMRAGKQPFDVEMSLDLDDSIGEIPLVQEDFSRVIVNICSNAFDAMRGAVIGDQVSVINDRGSIIGDREIGSVYTPHLKVRTKGEVGRVLIEIEDNGPGIPDDIKDKIMQPFFTTKKGTQGTGLGLSITHDIVKAHGGELAIKSQPGQTIFTISLTS